MYREPSNICWDKSQSTTTDETNRAVEHLSNKLGINKLQFSEKKNTILSYMDFQISKCNKKFEH